MVLVDLGIQLKITIAIAATATNLCAVVGNADFYLDLDADSTFPFALTGVAAQAFDRFTNYQLLQQ